MKIFKDFGERGLTQKATPRMELGLIHIISHDYNTIKSLYFISFKGTPEGKGVFLTVYTKASPNMDNISF